jgi:hypothetical protein
VVGQLLTFEAMKVRGRVETLQLLSIFAALIAAEDLRHVDLDDHDFHTVKSYSQIGSKGGTVGPLPDVLPSCIGRLKYEAGERWECCTSGIRPCSRPAAGVSSNSNNGRPTGLFTIIHTHYLQA